MFNLNRSCGVLSRAVPMLSQRYPHDPFKYEIDRFFPHYLFENRVSDPHFCYYCSELRSIRFPHCCCCCYRFLLDYLRWWHVEIYQPWRMCTMLITGTRHVAELSIIPHHVFSLGCANRCLETPRPFQTCRWASLNRLFIDGYERCKCVQLPHLHDWTIQRIIWMDRLRVQQNLHQFKVDSLMMISAAPSDWFSWTQRLSRLT